jgi:crotonobetainyl-CoA:carnitine CoA-transferase CaiB-like acyl-CoA transferase
MDDLGWLGEAGAGPGVYLYLRPSGPGGCRASMPGVQRIRNHEEDMIGWPPYVGPEAIADTIPGFTALIGILSALYQRQSTGRGARIDIAQLDSMLAVQRSFSFWNLSGISFEEAIMAAGPAVHGLYRASDDYVMFSVPAGRITDWFRELIGVEELTRVNMALGLRESVAEVVEIPARRETSSPDQRPRRASQ